MTLRQALAPLTRITITTQLLLWFLIISLIPCVVLTAIISISANRSLREQSGKACWRLPMEKRHSSRRLFASAGLT